MNIERNLEKSALDWRLGRALSSWQEYPDEREHMTKMQETINQVLKDAPLVVMIRQETLKNFNQDEIFIFPGADKAYGREEGCLIEFNTSKGIDMKVGEIKKGGYLFLEKGGQRFGYLRPKFIVKMEVK